MAQFTLGKNTRTELNTLLQSGLDGSKQLIDAVTEFINHTPIDFFMPPDSGYRTAPRQLALFRKGSSKCDGIDEKSKHQSGLAVDLVPWVSGKKSYKREDCTLLAGAFISFCSTRGIDLVYGGDWDGDGDMKDGWDFVHFEIR